MRACKPVLASTGGSSVHDPKVQCEPNAAKVLQKEINIVLADESSIEDKKIKK